MTSRIEQWESDDLSKAQLPRIELAPIKNLVKGIEFLEDQATEREKEMTLQEEEQRVKSQKEGVDFTLDVLREYRGVGEIITRTLCWYINDFGRFQNGKKFVRFFGLTPTPWISCKMRREQGISKAGNKELRRIAVQLAWLWVHWQP